MVAGELSESRPVNYRNDGRSESESAEGGRDAAGNTQVSYSARLAGRSRTLGSAAGWGPVPRGPRARAAPLRSRGDLERGEPRSGSPGVTRARGSARAGDRSGPGPSENSGRGCCASTRRAAPGLPGALRGRTRSDLPRYVYRSLFCCLGGQGQFHLYRRLGCILDRGDKSHQHTSRIGSALRVSDLWCPSRRTLMVFFPGRLVSLLMVRPSLRRSVT